MEVLDIQQDKVTVFLNKEDVFILRAVLSEIYAGVCVDAEEFETIHGIEKDKILERDELIQYLYDKLD